MQRNIWIATETDNSELVDDSLSVYGALNSVDICKAKLQNLNNNTLKSVRTECCLSFICKI